MSGETGGVKVSGRSQRVQYHELRRRKDALSRLVKDAPGLIAAITEKLAMVAGDGDPYPSSSKREKNGNSQKTAKHMRRVARADKNALDPAPFERLGVPVPQIRHELEEALQLVLATQKSILEVSSDFFFWFI